MPKGVAAATTGNVEHQRRQRLRRSRRRRSVLKYEGGRSFVTCSNTHTQ